MALQVGELFAKMRLEAQDFEQGLDKAHASGQSTADKVQGVFGRMSGFVSNTLSTAAGFITANLFGRIADGIKNVAGGMISGNAEFERYQTQFGVLLKSAPAAKERLDELAKFGATTPFDLPQLVRADKVLTAFGLDSEDTAKRFGVSGAQIRTTIGDVSAGTGADFEELSVTFGKFASGATGEAIARFQELGIATKEEMAKWGLEFSKSGQLLTPTAKAFTILEAHVRDKFGGMMDAQSKTFEGMMSNLQDWIGGTLRKLGQPIFEVLKDKLGVVLEWLGSPEVQAGLDQFATFLADGVGQAVDWLTNTAFPAMVNAWNSLQPAIQFVQDAMDAFVVGMEGDGGLAGGLSNLLYSLDTISPVFDTLGDIVAGLPEQFQAATDFISVNLQPIMAGLGAMLVAVVVPAFLSWAAAAISAAVSTALAMAPVVLAVGAIGLAVGLLYKAWTDDWGGIRTALTQWWEGTGRPIFDQVKSWLSVFIPAAVQVLVNFWTNTLWPALQAVWSWLSTSLFPTLATLAGWLKDTLVAAAVSLANFWTGTLWPALQKVWSFIDANILPILKLLADVYIALVKAEVRLLAELWTNVLWPALQKVWTAIQTNVMPVLKLLVDGGIKVVHGATQALVDLWNNVLGPAISKAADATSGVLQPALDGAKRSFDYIADAVGWVIQKIRDFKNYLDSVHIPDWLQGHSPPPLADWFRYIADDVQGVNNLLPGFSSMLAEAGAAARALLDAQMAIANFGGLGDFGINLNATSVAGAFGGGTAVTNNNNRNVSIGSIVQNNSGGRHRSLADEVSAIQGLGSRT